MFDNNDEYRERRKQYEEDQEQMKRFDNLDYEMLAHRGYNAYGDECNWLNYQGNSMPAWDELPQKTKNNWIAATKAIVAELVIPF